MNEGSTSSAERRTGRHRARGVVEMSGVMLFLKEGKRVSLDRLMFEGSCRLLGRRWELGAIRKVSDPE